MIGTDPVGKGGIATVVSVLINQGFLQKHSCRYIVSHAEKNSLYKLALLGRAVGLVVANCLFFKPGVVHVHGASRSSFIRKSLLLLIARLFACKTIFHLHGGGFADYAREASPLMRWWIRETLAKSTRVLVLSVQWAEFVASFSPAANVCVLPNPVELMPRANQAGIGQRLLFLGRVEKNKGIDELLEAVALLAPVFPDIQLAIGGEGDLDRVRQKAEKLGIQSHIEFLGWLSAEKKCLQLQQASVFVLPSYEEGLPMAMLEAMSMGKAVVVSAVGGIPSVVEHGVNGLLIPPRDVVALAEALSKLLANAALREQLGNQARVIIADGYASPVVADRLSAIYANLDAQA